MKQRFHTTCDCAMGCSVLCVAEWDDEDRGPMFSLDLYEHVKHQRRFRDRVRVAWAVLRGREPYTHGLVLYDFTARALGEYLLAAASSTERHTDLAGEGVASEPRHGKGSPSPAAAPSPVKNNTTPKEDA